METMETKINIRCSFYRNNTPNNYTLFLLCGINQAKEQRN